MPNSTTYDYIIAGAGSSGLSLAWHLIHSEKLDSKKLLVVDSSLKPVNDKTWCFWHAGPPPFERFIHKRWNRAEVFIDREHINEPLDRHSYQCIRSGTFRRALLEELDSHPSVTLLEADIDAITGDPEKPELTAGYKTFKADYIFQSCFPATSEKAPAYPLIQHFLGWEITANRPVFDPESFVLMDFDETYPGAVAFMYVLPWSDNRGLLEYTIFSTEIEKTSLYEEKIELYLYNKYGLKRLDYAIDRTEYGQIPMDDRLRLPWYAQRVLNLGTQGGLTKPSTGYTFTRIQEHSRQIVESLEAHGRPTEPPRSPLRYRMYDLWLLQIMHDHPDEALQVFRDLFKKNSFDRIFSFLSEQTPLDEDLKIMSSVPWRPFFRAIWKTKRQMPGQLFS